VSGSAPEAARRPPWCPRLRPVAAALALAILASGGLALVLQQVPAFSLDVGQTTVHGNSVSVNLTLASHRPWPVPVRAALAPINFRSGPEHAFFYLDPSQPAQFGSHDDVVALVDRALVGLRDQDSNTTVSTVTGAALPAVLAGNPQGILIVAEYGILPWTLLSNSSSLLRTWLLGGGTLIWAGGPLGYYEGGPGGPSALVPSAPYPDGLGWAGQVRLLGFPLTDPTPGAPYELRPSMGPLTGWVPAPMQEVLGIEYNGTVYGANTSELAAHGGLSLGFETPGAAGPGAPSPRTSLAWLPIGNGSLFYFGGGIWTQFGDAIPQGGQRLGLDITQLIAHPYLPGQGVTDIVPLTLGAFSTESETLQIVTYDSGVALIVQSSVDGVLFFQLSRQLTPSHSGGSGVHPGA
jgi:hypothetical protein